ncbi:MAG TPA: hypothetical protein VKS79_11595 [Gemmataceae bacterium]|nr:hypothetical protein [Gemmataceae bacterium]
MRLPRVLFLIAAMLFTSGLPAAEPAEYPVGIATQDITPKYAVRLSSVG